MILMLGFHVAHGHENGYRGSGQKQVKEIDSEAVHEHRAHEAGSAWRCIETHPELNLDHARSREHHADECGNCVRPLHLRGQHEVDQEDAKGEQRQQGDG